MDIGNRENPMDDDKIVVITRAWVDKAVIGLNLCPFAKAVQTKGQVRYVVSRATTPEALYEDLRRELDVIAVAAPDEVDTTLLIHPDALTDFSDYNDFLDVADATVEELELDGLIQVASFHPDYRFAGTEEDDIGNCTNRSPFPMLHLLREESIERAVSAIPDAANIYEKNIATMNTLGHQGWEDLQATITAAGQPNDAAQKN